MSETIENPYTFAPGSSTPGPEVTAEEGVKDLWGFFYLSLVSTLIITVAGLAAWWFARSPPP